MLSFNYFGETNIGCVRENNEDSFIAQTIWDGQHILCVVIDGMGGYEGGEIAAEIARSSIIDSLESSFNGDCLNQLKQAVINANNAIIHHKETEPKYARMGCVLTAALIDLQEKRINIAHVGDSRLYEYNNGLLQKLTHDHSLVGYREEIGELTESQAMHHPMRNMLDRAVGNEEIPEDDNDFIEASIYPITPNSQLLFCTDGLCDTVTQNEMCEILDAEKTVEEKCHNLIQSALDNGGKDNVTVIVAEFDGKDDSKVVQDEIQEETESDIEALHEKQTSTSHVKGSRKTLLACCLTAIVAGFIGFLAGMSSKGETDSALADSLIIKEAIIQEYRLLLSQPKKTEIDSYKIELADSLTE